VPQLKRLLENNRRWSDEIKALEPDYFTVLAKQQTPEYLWIGCSDSRVAANTIAGLKPGEIFVHRNIANLVVHTDMNCLSVMQFAVEVLKVKHIIVTGHYGCGGVQASMEDARHGLIDNWLRHIQDTANIYSEILAAIPSQAARLDKLCELNIIEQVINTCETTIVQDAWSRGQELAIHGFIYDIADGILRDLGITVEGTINRKELRQRFLSSTNAAALR
jgi:carbonic anhydrase